MSQDLLTELRGQRDRLRGELEQLRASIESLRKQLAEETNISEGMSASLTAAEEDFAQARRRTQALASRYQQLVGEECALRERIRKVQDRHGG
jgi:chromosome segregation ATPase